LNAYCSAPAEPVSHIPPGWDDWQALCGNSVYYNYRLSNNGTAESHGANYATDYLTDLVKNRSLSFIENNAGVKPMFMMISVPSSHQPADPAPQYSNLFPGA
jgi:N-acetylglucosamine-6-sulfatase